jgi:hypothetical protein
MLAALVASAFSEAAEGKTSVKVGNYVYKIL